MIYFIQAEGVGHIKIGFTDSEDAMVRLGMLQVGSPVPLRLLGTIPGTTTDEKDFHRRFASAKVHGEWFRPIAELLSLISPAEVKACEGVEIIERSVSIRVLTVGRKQFTKTLLDQLQEDEWIPWSALFAEVHERFSTLREELTREARLQQPIPIASLIGDYDLTSMFLDPNPVWGWVVGGHDKRSVYGYTPGPYRWLVYEARGRLHKQKDYDRTPVWAAGVNSYHSEGLEAVHSLYSQRNCIPGFRDEDQLFFGV